MNSRPSILGMEVDTISPTESINTISTWLEELERNKYVCVTNVHQCIETFDDPNFRQQVNQADLILTDSQILAWFIQLLGLSNHSKVIRGVTLMEQLCEICSHRGYNVGLYGGTEESLSKLKIELMHRLPEISITFSESPPFRPLSDAENQQYINKINSAKVNLMFVGIGCPKQEKWMAQNHLSLNCVSIGVGAAFDFISGVTQPSPNWVHPLGLEWLWRLTQEPKRLWRRYARTNPKFLWLVVQQLLGRKF